VLDVNIYVMYIYADLPFKNVPTSLYISSAVLCRIYKGVLLNNGAVKLVNGCGLMCDCLCVRVCVTGVIPKGCNSIDRTNHHKLGFINHTIYCVCPRLCTCVYVHVRVHMYVRACTCVCVWWCVSMWVCACVCL